MNSHILLTTSPLESWRALGLLVFHYPHLIVCTKLHMPMVQLEMMAWLLLLLDGSNREIEAPRVNII